MMRSKQPVASDSYADLVAAESAALGALSREIAERIEGLPRALTRYWGTGATW